MLEGEAGTFSVTQSRKSLVWRQHNFLGHSTICIADPVAIRHVLNTQCYAFQKPPASRKMIARILGPGILNVEGADHVRQRRIMNPAFSNANLKEMDPIWWDAAAKLRDQWLALLATGEVDVKDFPSKEAAEEYRQHKPEGEMVIDPSRWTSKATMDIIGEAGFGYSFNSLDSKTPNELNDAYASMMAPGGARTKATALEVLIGRRVGNLVDLFPWIIDYVPHKTIRKIRAGLLISQRESKKILAEREQEGRESGNGKDVMSLLLKSNKQDAKLQMSDEELLGQMTVDPPRSRLDRCYDEC